MGMKAYKVSTPEEWHAIRAKVVTATESAAILGLDKYSSVAKMQMSKQGGTFEGNAYTWVGNVLEPVVVQATNAYLSRNFKLFEDTGGKTIYADFDLGLGATPDASEGDELLETKTTGLVNWYKWSYSPPIKYLVQLQVQLICTETSVGYLAIMGTDLTQHGPMLNLKLSVFRVERSRKFEIGLKEQLIRYKRETLAGKTMRVDRKHSSLMELVLNQCYSKEI